MIKLSTWSGLEIRMQNEVKIYGMEMCPLKGWNSSNIWKEPWWIKISFRKKLRLECCQGMLAIIRCRFFCLPVWYPKIRGERKVFPWLQTFITRKLRGIKTYIFLKCNSTREFFYNNLVHFEKKSIRILMSKIYRRYTEI
jgi:hypothetical protein